MDRQSSRPGRPGAVRGRLRRPPAPRSRRRAAGRAHPAPGRHRPRATFGGRREPAPGAVMPPLVIAVAGRLRGVLPLFRARARVAGRRAGSRRDGRRVRRRRAEQWLVQAGPRRGEAVRVPGRDGPAPGGGHRAHLCRLRRFPPGPGRGGVRGHLPGRVVPQPAPAAPPAGRGSAAPHDRGDRPPYGIARPLDPPGPLRDRTGRPRRSSGLRGRNRTGWSPPTSPARRGVEGRLADATADVACETLLVAHEVGGTDIQAVTRRPRTASAT